MKKELEFHPGMLPAHANPNDEAERLPLNYLELIFRYKWRLIAGALVGLLIGHLLYLKAGPEFEAVAEILVQPKYTPPIKDEEKMLNRGAMPSEHIKLILSPLIASEAVRQGHLEELKTFRGEPDTTEVVLDGLKAKRIAGQDRGHSNVFDIRYTSKQADDAKKVLESVITAYGVYLKKSSDEQAQVVQQLAADATQAMVERLRLKDEQYNQFIQSVPEEFRSALGSPSQATSMQTNVAPQDVIEKLANERSLNLIKIADLESRKKAVEGAIAAGESPDALEHQIRRFLNTTDGHAAQNQSKSTEIGIYQSQLIPLLLKEKELARDYGRHWPDLVAVRENIKSIIRTYRNLGVQLPDGISTDTMKDVPEPAKVDLVALYLAEVKQQIAELTIKEEQLNQLISQEQIKKRAFAEYQSRERDLHAERTSLQELWTKQLEREQSVAIEKDSNGYRMTSLSPVKHALVIKRMMKFYVAGAAVCLFIVGLTCVLRELSDMTIKTVRDVRDIMHQPVLGSVCEFAIPTDRYSSTSGVPHPALRYLHAPSSVEAETYRTIRASFLVTTENLNAKVIMITSPEPGDGKTTLASNLAVALAQSGKRVLLIDGDLRRPTVHRMLRIPQEEGLSDVLKGTARFHEVVRPTVVERLSVVTTGTPPSNPAEILSSAELGEVLNDCRGEFDFVFLDAPPLLAVSDPCVMARHTDGVLLVVRLNKNPRTALIRVRQLLQDQEIPMIGTVVNGVPLKGGHEFGYTYYGEYAGPTTATSIAAAAVPPSHLPVSSPATAASELSQV
ncbi:polysaccharide biosynthesis tyrosine autokinase [Schlesneria paludicola]|uniref:polysaccharide biosynthesis tyrosine autokinase n=1 Tax=Schlesneria paludicola TaxID=360056 RepID=UPI00029A5A2F|nr:polysaccharide biosynthesis tyrosine autokinase [Schlesneria paludicola]